MKITYLAHSGFLVETKEYYLLFDYYTGKLPVFTPEKQLTVLVSHSHQDHYNREIFALSYASDAGNVRKDHERQAGAEKLKREGRHISYVLSRDIRRKQAEELVRGEDELLFVKARETYELYDGRMRIETLRSTDVGVAYIVTVTEKNGKVCRFYHAGDLNLWKWEGESKAHNNNMEANYRREMEQIKGRQFDAAFVPLDPRLEHFAFGGMDIFLEMANAEIVFPMHFWKKPEIIGEYLRARPHAANLVMLNEEGRSYEF